MWIDLEYSYLEICLREKCGFHFCVTFCVNDCQSRPGRTFWVTPSISLRHLNICVYETIVGIDLDRNNIPEKNIFVEKSLCQITILVKRYNGCSCAFTQIQTISKSRFYIQILSSNDNLPWNCKLDMD